MKSSGLDPELNLLAFRQNVSASFSSNRYNNDNNFPRYEINEDIVINLKKILKDTFPTSLSYLEYAYEIFNIPNKEGVYSAETN